MGDFKENYGMHSMKRRYLCRGSGLQLWCEALVVMLLVGCAPAMYSVNMKYVPTGNFPKAKVVAQPIALTVAAFEDKRKIEDNVVIGRVFGASGKQVPVLPKAVTPSRAVTEPIREFFRQAGYRVSAESPAWDLNESSINKGWGPILVGGSIDDLEIVCRDSLTITKYTAKVKITVVFADALKGKIFHKVTTESNASLEHVLFSEERLEQQINIALSNAIEKIFEGRDVPGIINEATKRTP